MRHVIAMITCCLSLVCLNSTKAETLERLEWTQAVELQINRDAMNAFPLPNHQAGVLNRQDMRATLEASGMRLIPADASLDENPRWSLNLRVESLQTLVQSKPVGLAHVALSGARMLAQHPVGLIHKLENRIEGLEQSFIVEAELGLDFSLWMRLSTQAEMSILRDGLRAVFPKGVVLQASPPVAYDAEGHRLKAHFILDGDRLAIRVRGATCYPVFIDPIWTSSGDVRADSRYGWSVAGVGDVNKDGFDDVVVSAPWFTTANTSAGKIYLYYGNASGLSSTPSWTSSGDDNNRAYFGYKVAAAGDVNNDDYADIAVGSYGQGASDEGKAFVYHGAFNGPLNTPAWSSTGDTAASAFYGAAITGAGDVNNDGFDDLIVGAPAEDPPGSSPGKAFVYHGSATGLSGFPAWTAGGEDQAGAGFGFALAGAGDVNNDGFDDVVVGANLHDTAAQNAGRAYAYLGSATGLSNTASWAESGATQTNAGFGWSVTMAGDVNADGYDEVLIGSPGWGGTGRVYLFNGQASGPATVYGWHYSGTNRSGAQYGWVVAGAGDVNADGYADLLVGAPGDDTVLSGAGRAFLYHGSTFGPQTPPDWSSSGEDQEGAAFGHAIDAAGDLNSDGAADFIVGAYAYDSTGQNNAGQAYAYLGVKYQPGLCEPPGSACDDSNPCTMNDACSDGGVCVGTAYTCDDSNICTADQCLGDGTCSFPHNTAGCDDGDPCTVNDRCVNAVCGGEALDCSWMDNQCALGICNPATGSCMAQPLPDGTPCEDNDPCTGDEICTGGVCLHQTYTCDGPDDPGDGGCGCAGTGQNGTPGLLLLLGLWILRRRQS